MDASWSIKLLRRLSALSLEFTAALFTVFAATPVAADGELDSLKWKHRIVLVDAENLRVDPVAQLSEQHADIDERDILWFVLGNVRSLDQNQNQNQNQHQHQNKDQGQDQDQDQDQNHGQNQKDHKRQETGEHNEHAPAQDFALGSKRVVGGTISDLESPTEVGSITQSSEARQSEGATDVRSNSGVRYPADFATALRQTYFERGDHAVVLIGKDGGVKSVDQRLDLRAIYALIDGMPMRQRELRQRRH